MKLDGTSQSQGFLRLWVDVVPIEDDKFPLLDITPPLTEQFEARVVIYGTEEIPAGDAFSNQSDLFVKAKLGGSLCWKSTDTHFLCKSGKGSFNYRLKFPVQLKDGGKVVGGEGGNILKLQCWDADLFSSR